MMLQRYESYHQGHFMECPCGRPITPLAHYPELYMNLVGLNAKFYKLYPILVNAMGTRLRIYAVRRDLNHCF